MRAPAAAVAVSASPSSLCRRSARASPFITVLLLLLSLGVLSALSISTAPAARADEIVATIPVGSDPVGVAVDPNTHTVYVTDSGDDSVTVIDGATDSVTATISLPSNITGSPSPNGIAVDPATDLVYVVVDDLGTNSDSPALAVLSGASGALLHVIKLPTGGPETTPMDVAVDAETDMVYVTSPFFGDQQPAGSVVVINGTTDAVVSAPTVDGFPAGVAVDQDTDAVYSADGTYPGESSPSLVAVVDGATGRLLANVSVPGNPSYIAADPSTDTVYAAEQDGLAVIDGATDKVVSQIRVGAAAPGSVAVDPGAGAVYVAEGGSIAVVDAATEKVMATVPVEGGASALAVDPDAGAVYVVSTGAGTVSVMQGGAPNETSLLTISSRATNGSALKGFHTTLYLGGRAVVSGSTPVTFALDDGQQAVVRVDGYANCAFSHWADTGSTNATRSIAIGGDTQMTAVYACNDNIASWNATAGLPSDAVQPGSVSCATDLGYVYCVTGNLAYYAPVSPSGIGSWSSTSPYPSNPDTGPTQRTVSQTCVAGSGYIYCVGGEGTGSGSRPSDAVLYAPVSSSGIEEWLGTTHYPVAGSVESCVLSGGFIYCMGDQTYYAPVSPHGGVGNWNQTTAQPSITPAGCVASGSYAYCIGESASYYAPLSPGGAGPWKATAGLPTVGYGTVCAAAGNSSYVYCVEGGLAYYASVSSSGIGGWTATTGYPTERSPLSCSIPDDYIYCVDYPASYFSLIPSLSATSTLTVTAQDANGDPLPGYYAVLNQSGRTIVATAYTPATFNLTDGQTYTVGVDGYGSCTFDHWLDTGNKTAVRQISITDDTERTAVMDCSATSATTATSTTTLSSSSSSSSYSATTTTTTASSGGIGTTTTTTTTTTSSSNTASSTSSAPSTSATSTTTTSPSTTSATTTAATTPPIITSSAATASSSSQASSSALSATYVVWAVAATAACVVLSLGLAALRRGWIGNRSFR